MGKIPSSSPQLNPNPNSNKTKPKKKQFHTVNATTRHADDSPVVTQTASDDAYSYNQRPIESNGFNLVEYNNFNVSSYLTTEMNDLKKLLISELERIRNLNNRIESGQLQPRSNPKVKKLSGNKRPIPQGLVREHKPESNNNNYSNSTNGNEIGSVNIMKMCRQVLTKLMKHKNSWIFNVPVDAAALGLHDYHQIIKRPMDLGTVKSNMAKNLYSSPFDFASDVRLTFNNAILYNPKTDEVHIMANELLDWFEDMFRPISKKIQNANSNMFEDSRQNLTVADDELQGSSWNDTPSVPPPKEPKIERVKKPKPSPIPPIITPIPKQNERLQAPPQQVPPQQPNVSSNNLQFSKAISPVRSPSPVPAQQQQQQQQQQKQQQMQVKSTGKQPKPRAKDPIKRDMSEEEKHKLGLGLQNLPQEKMPQLVQIIKKRNDHLAQDGDEIELDIEALDTETLWELDRFVTNWKKLVSKTKRQALMENYSSAPNPTLDEVPSSDRMDITQRPKKGEGEEDDVDIGEEIDIPENNFQPLEIDKEDNAVQVPAPIEGQNCNNPAASSSSSSSSGSDSSSSSDSDSGSSSGSDSDADEAQS